MSRLPLLSTTARPQASLPAVALKLLKLLIGLALAPLVAGEVWTIADLARAALPAGQWRETWFLSFAAGLASWLVVFVLLPRTTWIYVLGHEFTHALAAMLAGGKVHSFQVTAKGGHIVTDRVNWWITLSPYFVPLYALIWLALWLSVDFYYPLRAWQPILYFGLGVAWCFHLTFTVSMIRLGQTDLNSQGLLFSIMIILLFNLLTFLFVFASLAHGATFAATSELLWHRTERSYVLAGQGIAHGAAWALSLRYR